MLLAHTRGTSSLPLSIGGWFHQLLLIENTHVKAMPSLASIMERLSSPDAWPDLAQGESHWPYPTSRPLGRNPPYSAFGMSCETEEKIVALRGSYCEVFRERS
jgi:hypothetical protein